jgi:hypothetical protein
MSDIIVYGLAGIGLCTFVSFLLLALVIAVDIIRRRT